MASSSLAVAASPLAAASTVTSPSPGAPSAPSAPSEASADLFWRASRLAAAFSFFARSRSRLPKLARRPLSGHSRQSGDRTE